MLAGDEPSLAEVRAAGIDVVPCPIPERTPFRESLRVARSWLTLRPYAFYGRHSHWPVASAWSTAVHQSRPDICWLDHLDSFLYAGAAKRLGIPVVLDCHNVYSLILQRMAETADRWHQRTVLRWETMLLRRAERRAVAMADAVLAVSDEEADWFRGLGAKRVKTIPNGCSIAPLSNVRWERPASPLRLLFLGTLSWGPNVEGVKVFVERVFPRIREVRSDAELAIVGRQPSTEILRLADIDGITVHADVPSTAPFLDEATMMVVPLTSGGGTRLKILESMSHALPVVSTAVGAEGLGATDGEQIAIAPIDRMAQTVLELATDDSRRAAMARHGRSFVVQNFDWESIGKRCVDFLEELSVEVSGSGRPPRMDAGIESDSGSER
jgi:polysaccharide biosynthesis protein PslH